MTKSPLVQEVMADRLAEPDPARATRAAAQAPGPEQPSAHYRAFEVLGLVGASDLGPRSADKARVRDVIGARLAARKARHAP